MIIKETIITIIITIEIQVNNHKINQNEINQLSNNFLLQPESSTLFSWFVSKLQQLAFHLYLVLFGIIWFFCMIIDLLMLPTLFVFANVSVYFCMPLYYLFILYLAFYYFHHS